MTAFNFSSRNLGVRDKISWLPDKRAWSLTTKAAPQVIKKFAKDNNLSLHVDPDKIGRDFVRARDKALIDACMVWNGVDPSSKQRIKLSETMGACPAIQLKQGQAGYEPIPSDIESDVESMDCDDDDIRGDEQYDQQGNVILREC